MNNKIDLKDFDFDRFRETAISQIKSGQPLTGKGGILIPLLKDLIEAALEGEMDAHLDESTENGLSNRRNGKSKKTVHSGTESFEPEIVKKRQTVLNESLDNKILALYGLGMSYEAISDHLLETYGVEVSCSKIGLVTDRLLP